MKKVWLMTKKKIDCICKIDIAKEVKNQFNKLNYYKHNKIKTKIK